MTKKESLEYAKNNLRYCSETGIIQRTDRKNSCGSIDHYGYLILKIKKNQFKAHRLAWFLHYGEMPINVIDHINGIKTDNRISNLRDVSQYINILNTHREPNKLTNVVGVYIDKTKGLNKKYATKIKGKTFRFYSIEEAVKYKSNQIK